MVEAINSRVGDTRDKLQYCRLKIKNILTLKSNQGAIAESALRLLSYNIQAEEKAIVINIVAPYRLMDHSQRSEMKRHSIIQNNEMWKSTKRSL